MASNTLAHRISGHFVAPHDALSVFNFSSNSAPDPPFSVKEQLIFAKAYKKHPSNFQKIAVLLPGRTRSQCIRYYYANKSGRRFKLISRREKTADIAEGDWKRRKYLVNPPNAKPTIAMWKKPARGRASILKRQHIMCEEDEIEEFDMDTVPINEHIKTLQAIRPSKDAEEIEQNVLSKDKIHLTPPNLMSIRSLLRSSHTDAEIVIWVRSATVLPILWEWYQECFCSLSMRKTLHDLLMSGKASQENTATDIGVISMSYGLGTEVIQVMRPEAVLVCAEYAYNLVKANEKGFFQSKEIAAYTPRMLHLICARLLLTVFVELKYSPEGFFRVLWRNGLGHSMKESNRRELESKLFVWPSCV